MGKMFTAAVSMIHALWPQPQKVTEPMERRALESEIQTLMARLVPGEDLFSRALRQRIYAAHLRDLWHLRSDVLWNVASEYGESHARKAISELDLFFHRGGPEFRPRVRTH
jgi:hypothetical protein